MRSIAINQIWTLIAREVRGFAPSSVLRSKPFQVVDRSIEEVAQVLAESRRLRMFIMVTVTSVVFTVALFFARTVIAEEPKGEGSEVRNSKNTNGFFDTSENWFEAGSAHTTFSEGVKLLEAPKVGYYQEREEKKQEEEAEALQPAVLEKPAKKKFDARKASAEEIVKEFGDPTEDAAMTPQDNMPAPFKGMMAAMDSGNEELAFKYARQYVRHMKNIENRSQMMNAMARLAMDREGIREDSGVNKNPYAYLLNKDYEDAPKDSRAESREDRTRALLRAASTAEVIGPDSESTGEVPVDPKGEVDVLFFFSPGEEVSMKMAQTLQQVAARVRESGKVSVMGMSLEALTKPALDHFATVTSIDYPVENGVVAAQRLGVVVPGTVVLLTRSTLQSVHLQGERSESEIAGLIERMSGNAHQGVK